MLSPEEALRNRADIFFDNLDYQGALPLFTELRQQTRPDSLAELHYHARYQTAMCYWRMLESQRARAIVDSLLVEIPQHLGDAHPLYAQALTVVGNIHADKRTQADYHLAIDYFQRALAITERHFPPPSPEMAKAYERLGIANFLIDDYAQAIPYYEQALAMLDTQKIEDKPTYAMVIGNLGLQYAGMGWHRKAIEAYQFSRRWWHTNEEAYRGRIAASLHNQAESELAMGEWAMALLSLDQALALKQEKGQMKSWTAAYTIATMGSCYLQQEDWQSAQYYIDQYLSYWDVDNIDHVNAITGAWQQMSECARGRGDLVVAFDWLEQAIDLIKRAYGPDHLHLANMYLTKAKMLREQKRFGRATALLEDAVEITKQRVGSRHPLLAKVYGEQAELALDNHQWQRAVALAKAGQEALQLRDTPTPTWTNASHTERYLDLEAIRGAAAQGIGDNKAAKQRYASALAILNALWSQQMTFEGRRWLQQKSAKLTEELIFLLYQDWEKRQDIRSWETALQMIDANQHRDLRQDYSTTQKRLAKGQANIQFYRQLLKTTDKPLDSFPALLWRQQLQKAMEAMPQPLWEENKQETRGQFSIADLQAWASTKSANLLVFFWGQQHVFRLALTPNEVQFDLLQNVDELVGGINRWQTVLLQPPTPEWGDDKVEMLRRQFSEYGHALYRQLIGQLPTAAHTVIVPDGPLHSLAFGALLPVLPNPKTSYREMPYWESHTILRRTLHIADVLATAPWPKEIHYQAWAPAAVSMPIDWSRFSLADSMRLSLFRTELASLDLLPASGEEISLGEEYFAGQYTYGRDAKESQFLRTMAEADILHFAGHTWVHPTDPDYSALLLHPGTDTDGWVSSRELAGHQVPAALLILSSCFSGQGPVVAGEGMAHLGRTFRRLGTQRLLLSQWAADDYAALQLIGSFMQHLADGITPATARQQAVIHYLKTELNDWRTHPYFWANWYMLGGE